MRSKKWCAQVYFLLSATLDGCMEFGLHCKPVLFGMDAWILVCIANLVLCCAKFWFVWGFLWFVYDPFLLSIDFYGIYWWLHDFGFIFGKLFDWFCIDFHDFQFGYEPHDVFWGLESGILGPWVSKASLGGALEGFLSHFERLWPARMYEKPLVFAAFQHMRIKILFVCTHANITKI